MGNGADSTDGPRRTLLEVRRERRWRVWVMFTLLVLVAMVPLIVLGAVVGLILLTFGPAWSVFSTGLQWYHVVPTVGVALIGAAVYWRAAHRDARRRLLQAMGGRPLDPGDRYHRRLRNVVEELRLASGEPAVDAVVVPSLGMNAFAFSDLRGGSVVGVSEGAVSGLSRQQLQGVMAHEFAHILSGSHVTVTTSCLLFGTWESIGNKLDAFGDGLRDADRPWGDHGGGAGSLLSWFAEVAGGIVNGALSRQREFEADVAAAHYTRDPVSLALALRTIARHPVGRGYVPPGLAALCITGESARPATALERWAASHPPVEKRIDALLAVADVGRQEFEAQAEQLDELLRRRAHTARAPGLRPTAAVSAAARAVAGGRPPAGALAVGMTPAGAPSGGSVPPGGTATVAGPGERPKLVPLGAPRPCPECGGRLDAVSYEGVRIAACRGCGGRFAGADDVARIMARHEVRFTPRQQELAEAVVAAGNRLRREAVLARFEPKSGGRCCPRCGRRMIRRHYSYDVAVDIDYCGVCDAYWFDFDELEVAQIVTELRYGGRRRASS